MKRSLFSSCCLGLIVAGAMISVPLTSVLADQSKDVTKDAMNKGKDMAKDALKKGTDAANDAMGGMDPKMAEAFKRMEEYGALNENHAYLKQFEGEWTVASKWWMAEGAPAIDNTFTASAKLAFDGHYLMEKVQGNVVMGEGMPPQPFSGMCIVGYDNHKKQFSNIWMDNFTSGAMTSAGSASQGGKVFTFEGENYCPMNDKVCAGKNIMTIVDANTRKFEMWGPGLDGKVYKAMEMIYTRKK